MADEISLGEVVRHLDRIEGHLLRLVAADVYNRDQREVERRFTEIEGDLKDLREQLRDRDKTGGANIRQAIYAGLIPAALFLITILLQLKGGGG